MTGFVWQYPLDTECICVYSPFRLATRRGELPHVQRDGVVEAGPVHESHARQPARAVPRRDPRAPAAVRRQAVSPIRELGGSLGDHF